MNKKWMVLPLALLLVFGLAFFGCSTDADDDDDGDDKKGGGGDDTVSLAAGTKITLTDNFEYGAGYQSVNIAWSSLFSSIKENDVYELDIEFTVSRDLEYVLQWGIVDNSAAANYWKTLTKYVTIGGEVAGLETGDPEKGAYAPVPPAGALVCTVAGGPYTSKEKVTVTADPVTLSSVVVVFTTKGAGIVGEGDSGTKGPVDITFTKFEITKVTESAGGDEGGDGAKTIGDYTILLDLGDYTVGTGSDGNESQAIWQLTGTKFDDLLAAEYLVLDLKSKPTGGVQLIWQAGASSFAGWNQTDIATGQFVLGDGASYDDTDNLLIIELSKGLKDYDTIDNGTNTQAQLFIAYYSPGIAALGIEGAYLVKK